MAIAVMTVGAVAIFAMQTAAIRSNTESHQRALAVELSQVWVERLHRDALRWTRGGPSVALSPSTLANTTYLRTVPSPGTGLGGWLVPVPAAASGESATFDWFGRDTTVGSAMVYCTNIRLQWVYPAQAMRADVRVWYPRSSSSAVTADLAGCSGAPASITGRTRDVHFVYASTVLRWTPVGT